MDFNQILFNIAVFAIPLIFAITLHEAAHAFAAKHFGDPTAYMLGRMTLNPVKHIDPLWTLAIPALTLLFAPFAFGAAKPVPVNFDGLRNPKRDMIWVAAAGPLANLIMMICWGVILKILSGGQASLPMQYLFHVAQAGVVVNATLMVINLLPVLPLDGGRIVAGLLPNRLAYQWSRTETYGMFIVIGLIFLEQVYPFIFPLVRAVAKALYSLLGF